MRESIEKFAGYVLEELGLIGWRMEWTKCSGGECIKDMKKFTIPERVIGTSFEAREYILHEVAHIFTDDKWHGGEFYKEYVKLLTRFMISEGCKCGI